MVISEASGVDVRSFRLGNLPSGINAHRVLGEIFDRTPIFEVREACLKAKWHPRFQEEVKWAIKRIRIFLNIPTTDWAKRPTVGEDFETVLLLLRSIVYAPEEYQKEVFVVMLEVLERALHPTRGDTCRSSTTIKEAAVIVCGHLTRRPENYNERARELIDDIFRNGSNDTGDERERMLQRLLLIVQKAGDVTFLPVAEALVKPVTDPEIKIRGLDYQLKYLLVSREAIITDALARQAVAYLNHLKEQGA